MARRSTLEHITVDFETEGIKGRPHYPPKPVGFSLKLPGERRSTYYAWGHPTKNNCTKEQATRRLRDCYRSGTPLLFQHAKFDVDVAEEHLGLKVPRWDLIHDTEYLLFLENPHALSLSLKPSAERILGMKPEERDFLKEWILNNIPEAKRKPSEWAAYICKAPGDIVGRYADGDVIRTDKLFEHLHPIICEQGMQEAYDRERHLMPFLLQNEREGIHVDLALLEHDFLMYSQALEYAEAWLRKKLGVKELNFNAPDEVADALDSAGIVTQWVTTKTGKRSTAKKNMTINMFEDAHVASVYSYRSMLDTCISMFMEPWLAMARETDGVVFTTWNQVRQMGRGDKFKGARTGRMSSNPNFQNVPKNWKRAMAEGYIPPTFLKKLPPLPLMRKYFVPDSKSHLWGRRDYNQQELRILAHFEDGDLMRHYNEDPRFDNHAMVQAGIKEIAGLDLPRESAKIVNFGDIYGMGVGELANKIHVTALIAKKIKRAKRELLPDFKALEEEIRDLGKNGLPIKTWGGRLYYCEEPAYSKKHSRVMSFEYKLLNYLIQGSAAECTKESIIRYHEHPKCGPKTGDARFLVSVHDENNISGHKKKFKTEMQLLREVMQSVEFDVPMLSDGEFGPNWGTLQAFEEKPYVAVKAASAHA